MIKMIKASYVIDERYSLLKDIESIKSDPEYNKPDWDGYDAKPINHKSLKHAVKFIKLLPEKILPEYVDLNNEGYFTFEWTKRIEKYNLCKKFFSIDVVYKELIYAFYTYKFEKNIHGSIAFKNKIPKKIIDILTSL